MPETLPKTSLVICTYNRAKSLADTIAAIQLQDVPDELDWEIIVVDNNSTDDTHDTIQSLMQSFPNNRLSYHFEQRQGLSYARNTGIRHATGDIIVFTDDDVIPEEDWLAELVSGMQHYNCDAAGGFIEPLMESKQPAWLTEKQYGMLALKTDLSGPYEITNENNLPFGANIAVRRSVFMQLGYFNTGLGRSGNNLAGGEERDLMLRILKSGRSIMYFPSAKVQHKIESFRLRKAYFRKWKRQYSRNMIFNSSASDCRSLFGVPVYVFSQLIRAVFRYIRSVFSEDQSISFYKELLIWHFIGMILGYIDKHRFSDSGD